MTVMTELLNSTTMTIRPTELERRMGRLLRGPDGHGGDGAGTDGGDQGAGGDNGGKPADTNTGTEGGDSDAGSTDTGADKSGEGGDKSGEGGDGDDTASATLVKQAAAKSSAGKDGEGGESGKDADGEGDGEDDDKGVEPPEAYDLSGLKVTVKNEAGEDVEADLTIDEKLLEAATPHLKEAGLTNEAAKKLAPLVLDIKARALDEQQSAFAEVAANWAKEAKADPELGGKHWKETEHHMGRAFDRFGSPELDKLLEESRLGNHPAVVKFFAGVGKALGEDEGGNRPPAPTGEKKDREVVLYPDDQPKT